MRHEARRSERKVHNLMDAARKMAQLRAVYLAKRRDDSQQLLQVAGTRCHVHRDDGLYQAAQDQQGLPQAAQPSVSKGSYAQVGFSYKGDAHDESQNADSGNEDEDDDEEKDFSNDDRMETNKEFGIKRSNWLVYMDKKATEEENRQKEIIKRRSCYKKIESQGKKKDFSNGNGKRKGSSTNDRKGSPS